MTYMQESRRNRISDATGMLHSLQLGIVLTIVLLMVLHFTA